MSSKNSEASRGNVWIIIYEGRNIIPTNEITTNWKTYSSSWLSIGFKYLATNTVVDSWNKIRITDNISGIDTREVGPMIERWNNLTELWLDDGASAIGTKKIWEIEYQKYSVVWMNDEYGYLTQKYWKY